MIGVRNLAYLGLTSDEPDAWRRLAGELLGAQVVDRGGPGFDIRLDRRAWRVRIAEGDHNDLGYAGWEVADDVELDALVTRLEAQGHSFNQAPTTEAETRQVQRMVVGKDPDGNRVELVHSSRVDGAPFVSPHQVKFQTEPGVGHMVLYCDDLKAMMDFYCGGLGLRVSDSIQLDGEVIHFLRCNRRHHSLALVAGRGLHTLQHLMLEVDAVDAVGAAFERCFDVDLAQTTLGRHTNDEMLSFYAMAPGGYTVEYGYGGRLVDEASHHGAVYDTTSWWGHRELRPSR